MTTEAPPLVEYGVRVPVTVHFDDLDALGLLHNARYPLLVERAWSGWWAERGFSYRGDWNEAQDACNAVREFRITYESPVTRAGEYSVHLWLERLGRTGLTYGSASAPRTAASRTPSAPAYWSASTPTHCARPPGPTPSAGWPPNSWCPGPERAWVLSVPGP